MNELIKVETNMTKQETKQEEIMSKAIQKALINKWINLTPEMFLAENIVDVVLNAESPDIKGNMHKDFTEINRALFLMHKALTPQKWGSAVNIAFFTPPPQGEKLNY